MHPNLLPFEINNLASIALTGMEILWVYNSPVYRVAGDFILGSIQTLSLNELDTERKFNYTSVKNMLKYFMQVAQTLQTSYHNFQLF